MRIQEEYDA
jgi:hypothetical protein